ncbi:ribosome-inactivating protein [Tanacetum coccineum]
MLYRCNPKAIRMSVPVAVRADEQIRMVNGDNARVWLANCVISTEPRQQWALYGDNTIRLYNDRTLYVTSSDGH